MLQAEQLDHVAVTVRDLDRSIAWYQTILRLERRFQYRDTTGRGHPVGLCSGGACIVLFPAEIGQVVAPLQGHIALRLDRDNFERAHAHLQHHGIAFEFVAYETCHSLYVYDPDGYQIELSTYEL